MKRGVFLKWMALLAAATVMLVLIRRHTPWVNGPSYWKWHWQLIPDGRILPLMLPAAIPIIAALFVRPVWISLLLMILGTFGMRMAYSVAQTPDLSLDFIRHCVTSPSTGSYWTAARGASNLDGILAMFPQLMTQFPMHATTKPPGPVLYYLSWIRALDDGDSTAIAAGIGLGLIAALSLPACYLMLRSLTSCTQAALAGAAFFALCPGFIANFPMFDPVYPIFSAGLCYLWVETLRRNSPQWATGMGIALFAATFVTFNFLIIGIFYALLVFAVTDQRHLVALGRAIRLAMIVFFTCAAAYAVLWFFTGYDPIETLRVAMQSQNLMLQQHPEERPYPATIWNDLRDFVLGSGWISALLVVFWIAGTHFRAADPKTRHIHWIVLAAMVQLLFTAISGLLQSETARVWNFFLPLLMLPIGLELARSPVWMRATVLAMLALLTTVMCQNMVFLR